MVSYPTVRARGGTLTSEQRDIRCCWRFSTSCDRKQSVRHVWDHIVMGGGGGCVVTSFDAPSPATTVAAYASASAFFMSADEASEHTGISFRRRNIAENHVVVESAQAICLGELPLGRNYTCLAIAQAM